MTDISLDPRYQPVLDALVRLHGTINPADKAREFERGQVAEFLVMLDAAMIYTEREKLAALMMKYSIPTGHGDTFDDLINELDGWLSKL